MNDEMTVQTERAARNNPHRTEDGFIAVRKSRITGQHVVMYDSKRAGLPDAGRWTLVCVAHGTVASPAGTRRACRSLLDMPSAWCCDCASMLTDANIAYVPLTHPADTDIRRKWAWIARGDPEKITLFREMYGEDPDRYW